MVDDGTESASNDLPRVMSTSNVEHRTALVLVVASAGFTSSVCLRFALIRWRRLSWFLLAIVAGPTA